LKRVLLIGSDDLITGGVASLMQQAHDLILLKRAISDIPELINEIHNFSPNILVLKNNINYVTSSSMMDLLSKFPDLRILAFDEKKNIIHVYEKQELRINQSTDLLGLIRKVNQLEKDTIITK
jgi:hypothetical protein